MTIDFKGSHYPKPVVLYAVFFYVRYGVCYRDLEEIMAECGVDVGHATLNQWVVKYASQVAASQLEYSYSASIISPNPKQLGNAQTTNRHTERTKYATCSHITSNWKV